MSYRSLKTLFLVPSVCLMASCNPPPEEYEAKLMARYQQQCVGFGFKPGTETFSECVKDSYLQGQANQAAADAAWEAQRLENANKWRNTK